MGRILISGMVLDLIHLEVGFSGCIHRLAFADHALAKIRVDQAALGHKVHRASKKAFQAFLQLEIGLCKNGGCRVVEGNQKIKIAAQRVEIGAYDRPKRVEPVRTRAAAQINDFFSFLIQK